MYKILTVLTLMLSMELNAQSIYDFKVDALTSGTIDFSKFKGKKILIVNTASECGYTPQYEGLESLYKEFKDKKLVIVGVPANQFGGQEPGSNAEIANFCQKNYGVTFPMAAKMVVKGKDISPLFSYLTKEAAKLGVEDPIKWNFTKFLIDEKGNLVKVFNYKTKPMGEEIVDAVN